MFHHHGMHLLTGIPLMIVAFVVLIIVELIIGRRGDK